MNDHAEINSAAWWEDYFEGEWERHGGPAQTRHFMQRLLAALPEVDRTLLGEGRHEILDWGCAFGDGADELARAFPDAHVVGLDGAAAAVRAARGRYPALDFEHAAGAPGVLPRPFDVVVNSNSLEHFEHPLEVLRANLASTRLLHLALVPYREEPLSVHHRVRFDEDSFPPSLDGFERLWQQVVEVEPLYWPGGRQLLVAYGSAAYRERRAEAGRTLAERAKWNAYYASLPEHEIDAPTRAFNDELVGIVRELLPGGGRVLEAGCGGGSQSLALAQAGFGATLLDFSAEALDYARRSLEAHGVQAAYVRDDAFALREPGFELVFNAGVLEHYRLDEQARFLRGMASRSTRYVLVLIPNRACYWYWLWRARKTAQGDWPFGREVPQESLADAFARAGLAYLGQRPVGAGWTESFIESLVDDADTRELIVQLHRSAVIPESAKGYLIAALGTVDAGAAADLPGWNRGGAAGGGRADEEWTSTLADALAGRIRAEQAASHVLAELDAARRLLEERSAELNLAGGRLVEAQRQLQEASDWGRRTAAEKGELLDRWQALRSTLGEAEAERDRARAAEQEARLALGTRLDELNVANGRLVEAQRQLQESSDWGRRTAQELGELLDRWQALQATLRSVEAQRDAAQHEAMDHAATRAELAGARREHAALLQAAEAARRDYEAELARVRDELNVAAGKLIENQRQVDEVSAWATRLAERNGELAERVRRFELVEERRLGARLKRWARIVRDESPTDWARRIWRRIPMTPGQRHRAGLLVARLRGRPAPGSPAASGTTPAPAAAAAPGAAEVAAVTVIAPRPDRADVFVFAIIDWHFRIQRPQQIARALAREGHRVYYLTNHFADASDADFSVEELEPGLPLYQVKLAARGALARLLLQQRPQRCIALVEHPWWWELSGAVPNATFVYDCMDHHEGFGNVPEALLRIEERAFAQADVVTVTSQWLAERIAAHGGAARQPAIVRNGCDHAFFSRVPAVVHRDQSGRRTIGYFGAIAEWFDLALLRRVAGAFPDCRVLLIGNDTVGARDQLAGLANVEFTGEQPYAGLPSYLHGFDVCLLPFQVLPLTLATNPVKVYEYLAAGKPVVAVDLPEMAQFGELVYRAADANAFVAAVAQALAEDASGPQREARSRFAAQQTWAERARALAAAVQAHREPRVSVVVLTYNNLALTQACLASIEQRSDWPDLELIVVDNASTDGSPEWLAQWARERPDAKLILNERNLGFAAGNNVGLAAASGEYLVVLNNDTVVTRGWVRTLVNHMRRVPQIGLLGPITNNIGNEARVETRYASVDDMPAEAEALTLANAGLRMPLRTAAFFCVMLRRAVYAQIGGLSEDYGLGFFEDDDYCRRAEAAGWQIACADDVFVHHELSASFGKMAQDKRRELFERNLAVYESRWGKWEPHRYRDKAA